MLSRLGRGGSLGYAGHALATCRDWLGGTFRSEQAHGLLAPWVLHTGLGPDSAVSGFMTQVIACAIQLGGMPVPVGGGVRLVDALTAIVRENGGEVRTGADVERILVSGGTATAVRIAGGETVTAGRAVIASVTPTQLYGRLLGEGEATPELAAAARRYRYGRAGMQIHLALSEPPAWYGDERLGRTAIVHVTSGLDGVSRAVNEAERGLLPAEATIVAGQPCAVDPSRAPEGKWVVWIQLQELPAGRVKGDAAGELDVGDGTWTESLRERYADRIVARLGRHITNLERATLRRVVLSPADLEAVNCNLVGGDIYAGSCALDQNLLWRPLPEAPGHETPVDGLYHIGASTHPGPGLGAGSGYLVAKELLKPALPKRLLARVPVVGARVA
jgi:phytoene dehydrogenase-like protein